MSNSKQIAGLVGPTIVAMLVSEFPLVQPHLYDAQIPPVVYLSGVLMRCGDGRVTPNWPVPQGRRRASSRHWRTIDPAP